MMRTCDVNVTGVGRTHREMARTAVLWFFDNHIDLDELTVNVKICKYTTHQCWGSVERAGYNSFDVTIANNQSIRDFIATVMHEMVHVNQYVTGVWEGDGEAEAESRQYDLADDFWRDGNL